MEIRCLIIASLLLFVSCGKTKKRFLETGIEEPIAAVSRDSLQYSSIIYNAAKAESAAKFSNVIQKGVRIADSANPPIKLNLSENELTKKQIELGNYYSKVNHFRLKHPLSSSGGRYLGDISMHFHFEDGSSWLADGMSSEVYLSENQIVVGDLYTGFHVYNSRGSFLYTLAQLDNLPIYDKNKNTAHMTSDETNWIEVFSTLENIALICTKEDSTYHTHYYDLSKQKGLANIKSRGSNIKLINNQSALFYNPNTNTKEGTPYLQSINLETLKPLNAFYNSNPTGKGKENPENHLFTYYDNILTTKQAYNDTIYRIKNVDVLTPAYIINRKINLSNKNISYQDSKNDQLSIQYLLESHDFLFIISTDNYDTPNNRHNKLIKYGYYYYDKKEKKLYADILDVYPEKYTLGCNIKGAIPVLAKQTKNYKKKLYSYLTKNQIDAIIKSQYFTQLSDSQQNQVNEVFNSLDDHDLFLQILE